MNSLRMTGSRRKKHPVKNQIPRPAHPSQVFFKPNIPNPPMNPHDTVVLQHIKNYSPSSDITGLLRTPANVPALEKMAEEIFTKTNGH